MIKKILICVVSCFQTASIIASSTPYNNNGLAGATSSSTSRASARTPENLVTTQPGTSALSAVASTNALPNLAGAGSGDGSTTTIGGSGSAISAVLAVFENHIVQSDNHTFDDTLPAPIHDFSALHRSITVTVATAYIANQQQVQNDQNTTVIPSIAGNDEPLDQVSLPDIRNRLAAHSTAGSGAQAARSLIRPASKRGHRGNPARQERSAADIVRNATETISVHATTSITLSDEEQQNLARRLHEAAIGHVRPPSGHRPVSPASNPHNRSPRRFLPFGRSTSPARAAIATSTVFPSIQRSPTRNGGKRLTSPSHP